MLVSSSPSDERKERRPRACGRCIADQPAHIRKRLWLLPIIVTALLVYRLSSLIVSLFHWAEARVDGESPTHMFVFFAVTLPFHTGLPIPIIHQVWAVAIGCFFRWHAFPILLASLCVGVPLPFLIGRRLAASAGGAAEDTLRRWTPRAFAYLKPLRRAIAGRPVRSCFLIMWAPLPTSTLPLLVGFLIPSSELPIGAFLAGALPSKLLHFGCDVLVGIEAGSLATALDAHDDLPGVNDLPRSQRWARAIAVGAMVLTVAFVGLMIYTMHGALREMRAKEAEAAEECERLEGGMRTPSSAATVRGRATPLRVAADGRHMSLEQDPEAEQFLLSPGVYPLGHDLTPPRTWELTPARFDAARAWDASAGPQASSSACGARSPAYGSEPPSPRTRATPQDIF